MLNTEKRALWLTSNAPLGEVVISSRCRIARNLRYHRFPHRCESRELVEVERKVTRSVAALSTHLTKWSFLSKEDRDELLNARLISPEFECGDKGHCLFTDAARSLSIMVNEEDHIRLQSLTPGFSIAQAVAQAEAAERAIAQTLEYARGDRLGYLTASPSNLGAACRLSCMLHLIALGRQKKLANVLSSLAGNSIVARGLYGEGSRAVGAFFQISSVTLKLDAFEATIQYVADLERQTRLELDSAAVINRAIADRLVAIESRTIQLGDAIRVLGSLRLASCFGAIAGVGPRRFDGWLSQITFQSGAEDARQGRDRAAILRKWIEPLRFS